MVLKGVPATPLILLAVLNSSYYRDSQSRPSKGASSPNTLVAILIGLLVANILRPRHMGRLAGPAQKQLTRRSTPGDYSGHGA